METTTNTSSNGNKMTAIERALAAAKARKAAMGSNSEPEAPVAKESKAKKETQPAFAKAQKAAANEALTEIQRDAARQKRDAERVERLNAKAEKMKAEAEAKAAKKAEREAKKAEKAAAKASEKTDKKPAHMKKVERARAKCPALNGPAEALFGEITANLSAQQIDALAQHLLVHNRATATIRATEAQPLPMSATVRITGGEAKFIGMVGTVVHTNKLRAKVAVEGVRKPVYIYTGQAEIVSEEAPTAIAS